MRPGRTSSAIEVTLLNRRLSATRPAPTDVEVRQADVRNSESVRGALGNRGFDAGPTFQPRVPFAQGAREIVNWYLDYEEAERADD